MVNFFGCIVLCQALGALKVMSVQHINKVLAFPLCMEENWGKENSLKLHSQDIAEPHVNPLWH